MIKCAFLLFFPFFCSLASANDPRIRTEIYNKSSVYDIYTQVGRASLIQLEDDESLSVTPSSVLGIGDSDAWNLGVRGNNIVLKPTQKLPQTNVVVVTNKRTYSFELHVAAKETPVTYVLRFRYLDSEAAKAAHDASVETKRAQALAAAAAATQKIVYNTNYVWRGLNPLLAPSAAYDDGRFTYLSYNHAGELPVFYKVLPDGSESLLNTHIDSEKKEFLVIHDVIRTVRVRLGQDVIEVINRSYVLPKINSTGSSVPGASRVDKGSL